ncbi:MAG: aminotransferase class I/II-fold pyridoxal phosphate-dependent enzyme [Cyclobacteriaceae bacterium]
MAINRREWLQQSLLASAALLVAGSTGVFGCASGVRRQVEGEPLQLNWNENPYGPSEAAAKAVNEMMKYANRYPDEHVVKIKNKLAERYNLKPSNFLLTAGSTEVLSLLGQHVGLKNGEILTGYPTFPTMLMFGEQSGADVKKVDLDENDRFDLGALHNAITSKTTLVFICNPNNPTGTELPTEDLKSFCRSVPENVLICLDEAYIEYSKAGLNGSMIGLVDELPNLVICRTFSKAYGLAGLRMGYAVSNAANINALRNRHLGFEMATGWPPLVAAEASLDDPEFIKMCVAKNEEGRQIVYKAFDSWDVKYNRTSTNFIYTRHDRFDKQVVSKMKKRGILITKWPDMYNHIRISIGKPDEMRTFVEVAEDFLV